MERRGLLLVVGVVALVILAVWWGTRKAELESPGRVGIVTEASDGASDELEENARKSRDEPEEAMRVTAELPDPATTSVPTHRIVGRVVDEGRRPVVGAQVALGSANDARAKGVSGDAGRFELLVDLAGGTWQWRDAVLAWDGRGRKAVRELHLLAAEEGKLHETDAQTLVLLPAHPLTVQVRQDRGLAAEATVKVAFGHLRLVAGEYTTDAQGRLELADLPPGPVHLTASLGESEGRARIFLPEEREATIVLEPLGGVDVLVVDAETGPGIANADLAIQVLYSVPAALPTDGPRSMGSEFFSSRQWPGSLPGTDEEGRARIEGLAPGVRYQLSVKAQGYEPFPQRSASGARLTPGGELVRVELTPSPSRSVRWQVVTGEVPVPPDGAAILLRRRSWSYSRWSEPPLPEPGRMEGSILIVDDIAGHVSLIGEAPDGALANLWAREDSDIGGETSFRRPRRIEVIVRDEAGAPVVDAKVGARDQGNNPLCEQVPTDAEGRAVLEGLYGGLAEVSVIEPGKSSLYGPTFGTVDLEQGDGRLEVTLGTPERRRARLTLRIDGVPCLPARFQLTNRFGVEVLEEFPDRGELLLELAPTQDDAPVAVWLNAVGYATATAEFVFTDGGAEPSATLDLVRTALLIARVKKPENDYMSILPQRFDEEKGAWACPRELRIHNGLGYPNGPGGSFVFQGVTPGRWRVIDERSGAESNEAELSVGEREVQVELDLATIEWVTGRVEVNDPAELSRVRVLVEKAATKPVVQWRPGSEPPDGAWLRDDAFRARVPGDEEVTLVAWHPWLVPDPDSGRLNLRGGREGVVLRLVEGDELRLPAPQLDPRTRGLRVARYAGGAGAEGEALEWHHAVLVDGDLRCALPRGRWTLLVEPGDDGDDFAPLVLRDVAIEGATELPAAEFTEGSTLRVRLILPDGTDAPRTYIFVERIGAPVYHRSINSGGEEVVLLSGFGPGRYRVSMSTIMDHRSFPEQEIELDGVSDLELECDLR